MKTDVPSEKDLLAELGRAKDIWERVIASVVEKVGTVEQEWKPSKASFGRICLLKQKKRTLLYLMPEKDALRVAVVLGERAVAFGIIAGIVCFYAVALKNKLGWDDALDVWGEHGVGGFIGIVLCGVFATTLFNPAGTDGLLRGNTHFFLVQLGAVLLSSVWAFVFTYGMLWIIDRITTVKVDEAGEEAGLDSSIHGEAAYLEGI